MNFLFELLGKLNVVGTIIILIILTVFAISFLVNIVIRRKYINIEKDIYNRQQRKIGVFKSDLLNRIVEDYKLTAINNFNEVNTQAIIEKNFSLRLKSLIIGERLVKSTISILITLGLLGTFLGLTLSVGELVKLLSSTSSSELMNNYSSIADGLILAVSGMAVAFITSLFGIACSIILTLLQIVFNVEETREKLMVHIEEYLDNTVSLEISKDRETEYSLMNRILKETFIEFGEKIEYTLKNTVETFGTKLSSVVMDVHVSSKVLDNTVDKFDLSLKNFSENIRDFSEFNFNLKNNIERMDVSFIKVTEALIDTSKTIINNYNLMENFSKDIKSATVEIVSHNKQVVEGIGNLVHEVEQTIPSIKKLSYTLDNDINIQTQNIQHYQDKFNNLIFKLTNEIDSFMQRTSDVFSRNLEDNGKAMSEMVVGSIQNALKEVLLMLDSFKENERLLAKTIAMLPDQALTYNETASARIGKQLDEIKGFLTHGTNE